MSQELLELLNNRCSVRSFLYKKVETKKIEKIIEAARVAPTACNKQPERIVVINTNEGLEKLQKCKPQHYNEQLAFIVCYDKNECWTREYDNHNSGEVDATICATHMMLEAESLGVNSTWVMYFDPQKLINEFNINENIVPVCILVMGYKTKDYKPSPRHFERKKQEEIII